ncbi:MAG: galactokinase [Pseudomonadota bacterium]
MIEDLFSSTFGAPPIVTQHSPGRVNLIGSHTDYNGGMVLPTALPVGVTVAMRPVPDPVIRIHSAKFGETVTYALTDAARGHWADYAAGAVALAHAEGLLASGAELLIKTTMADGAGISSSAALIVCILKAARKLSHSPLSDTDIARLARRVENDYVGMPCGIMDQMAVAIATTGTAMALNTENLDYELIDLPPELRISVIHSGYSRKLSDGRYKIRKEECDEAARLLGVDQLCLMTEQDAAQAAQLPPPLNRRARHLVREHNRVLKAISYLKAHDFPQFGAMITESHMSLSQDFEISIPEIDALVADAVELGALGARLTGGGFGGCIVACTHRSVFEDWLKALLEVQPKARLIC